MRHSALTVAASTGCGSTARSSRCTPATAILLRPSNVDQITKISMSWVKNYLAHLRSSSLADEVAAGAKAAVL
ncbi:MULTISPECIES: hypothetical protein [unclassified Streptomyces]|uniref:hypothetical protein n=1 Tax=unclassified Streptomyces TaxID=2593676 RepID=UPI0035D9950E